jgi:galactokinase
MTTARLVQPFAVNTLPGSAFAQIVLLLVLQVSQLLGVPQQQVLQLLPQGLQSAAQAATQLHLQQRACHVFSEAHRVLAFKQVCEDSQLHGSDKMRQLGALLNASHSSCSQLYQCSCDELDSLVEVARAAGALGARLTGGRLLGASGHMLFKRCVSLLQWQHIVQLAGPS